MLLAIDTATQLTSIALFDGRQVRFEQTWETGRNHGIELAPAIRRACDLTETEMAALSAVAVCIGPGTYTGLRIGVSLAKGVAAARALPLVGLTAMDILVAAQPKTEGHLMPVLQAGRGRIIAALYVWQHDAWTQESEPEVLRWDEALVRVTGPTLITGEVDNEGHDAISAAQGRGAALSLTPPAFRLRRAAVLAQEAWTRVHLKRDAYAAALVVPVYAKAKDTP